MDPPYMDVTPRAEIEHIRERNRIAKRRSRARQRQKQNAVSGDEDQSQDISAIGEAPVQELEAPWASDQFRTSGSSVTSGVGSSAGTFEHIETNNESPSWIHPVPPVTPVGEFEDGSLGTFMHIERGNESPSWIHPVPPVTPSAQFDRSNFATCQGMDANDLDLTPFGAIAPFTTFSSTTASPDFSSLDIVDQQPLEANTRRRSSDSNRSSLGLLHLAVRNGSKAIAQALLAAGASANSRDNSGVQPLHLAVQHRRRSMAELLLTYEADPDSVNAAGVTPLELAVRHQDDEIVNLLISRGAKVT